MLSSTRHSRRVRARSMARGAGRQRQDQRGRHENAVERGEELKVQDQSQALHAGTRPHACSMITYYCPEFLGCTLTSVKRYLTSVKKNTRDKPKPSDERRHAFRSARVHACPATWRLQRHVGATVSVALCARRCTLTTSRSPAPPRPPRSARRACSRGSASPLGKWRPARMAVHSEPVGRPERPTHLLEQA